MHPAMDQRDWERRARSKHRAGPRARGPWRHPHALWLAVIVAVVVLLQGATYARIHARSSRIQSADEEIARRAEAIRAMLVRQEDLREQVAQLREVVVRMDAAVVDTLERGAAARKSNAEPTAATTTTPTLASDPSSSSSVASLRERQRILMDRAALANRLAGVAPTDADEAFFDANDAALREMREERAAYARREAAEAAAGKMVWSKSVNDAMASPKTGGARARAAKRASSSSTWDDEDRVVVGSARGERPWGEDSRDDDGAFDPAPKSLFASYLGRYGAGGSFLTPSASEAGRLNAQMNGVGVLEDTALGRMGASRLRRASAADNPSAYAAVVIMACDRADYLERTVASVRAALGERPGDAEKFPVFISQDGRHKATRAYAEGEAKDFHWMQHLEDRPPTTRTRFRWDRVAYYRIAAHYKWAMKTLFDHLGYERVIVLEDDMELSPDFFGYFEAAGKVMDADPSVYAVSSWNDNGQKIHVSDERRLYRSDFFPGLGWMLHEALWRELAPKWPDSYWDDWMRLSDVRKGRESIRPEVCRTFNFGEVGSSKGQFFRAYLREIEPASERIDWDEESLAYLDGKAYEDRVRRSLASATMIDSPTRVRLVPLENAASNVYKVIYASERDFNRLARRFGVFAEWKDGVPRAGYRGVVTFKMYRGRATVMLVPAPSAAVAKTYAQWTGTRKLEEAVPGGGGSVGVGTTTTTKGTAAREPPPEAKKDAATDGDDGLSEEERNERLTQAMERWWQYEAGT